MARRENGLGEERPLRRVGRRLRSLEDSLETSVTPWAVLTVVAGVGGLLMVAWWAITGDWPEELR